MQELETSLSLEGQVEAVRRLTALMQESANRMRLRVDPETAYLPEMRAEYIRREELARGGSHVDIRI